MVKLQKTYIRFKVNVFLFMAYILFCAFIYFTLNNFIMDSVNQLQEDYAIDHLEKLELAIEKELKFLERMSVDWSMWNDAYEYIKTPSDFFVKSNLLLDTYTNLTIDYMAYLNREEAFIYNKIKSAEENRLIELSKEDQEEIADFLANKFDYSASPMSGIIELSTGDMMLAVNSVTDSLGVEVPNGIFLIGKYFDDDFVKSLSLELNHMVSIAEVKADAYDNQSVFVEINGKFIRMMRVNEDILSISTELSNIYGHPFTRISIEIDRDIYKIGRQSLFLTLVVLSILGLIMAVFSYVFLDKALLGRLVSLNDHIEKLRREGILSKRLPIDEKGDELSKIAINVNDLLGEFERIHGNLLKSEETYRMLIENGNDVIFFLDCNLIIQYLSPNANRILGVDCSTNLGQSFSETICGNHRDIIDEFRRLEHVSKTITYDIELVQPDNSVYWYNVRIKEIVLNEIEGITYLGIIRDTTEKNIAEIELKNMLVSLEEKVEQRTNELVEINRKLQKEIVEKEKVQEEIKQLAFNDHLTGLANRFSVMKQLEHNLLRCERNGSMSGVLFLDIDGFKGINDEYGHEIGDDFLIKVATLLRRCVRKSDMVARLGGDEFIIVMDLIDNADDLRVLAEKILRVIEKEGRIENINFRITLSIGGAIYPIHGATGIKLIKCADLAMYKAKNSGKNHYQLYDE